MITMRWCPWTPYRWNAVPNNDKVIRKLKWPDVPYGPPEPGWTDVLTPLGASLHVRWGSVAEMVCDQWAREQSRGFPFAPTDPEEVFSNRQLSRMSKWLVAELLAGADRMDDFTRVIASHPSARVHILKLPAHVVDLEPKEVLRIEECADIARRLEARAAATAAANEALASGLA